MKIYFTRHGETELNHLDRVCGISDIELTDKGRKQAEELAERIKESYGDIDVILCSPMKRARDTAEPTAKALGITPVIDERLREWNYGTYEGKDRFTDGYAEAKLEFGVKMPGGESVFDLVGRVWPLIEEIKVKYKDKNVLLVCHGGICRVLEAYARGMTREQFANFFMGNCEIREFEV